MQAMPLSVATATIAIIYLYQNEIKSFLAYLAEKIVKYFKYEIVIDAKTDHNITRALKSELDELYPKNQSLKASDGGILPSYSIAEGIYKIGNIKILVEKDHLTVYSYYGVSIDKLQELVNQIYTKRKETDDSIQYFLCNGSEWKFPFYRRMRNIDSIDILDPAMQDFLDDIEDFVSSEANYAKKSTPYRRGYLLEGVSGSGKSLSIEMVAMKYKRPIYMISLNSKDMTDAILTQLVSNTAPYSLIVFEEIDKQLEALKTNKTINISGGGLLSALDGPQRLSHSSIVILTTNNIAYIQNLPIKKELLRKGRIDKIFSFTKPFI